MLDVTVHHGGMPSPIGPCRSWLQTPHPNSEASSDPLSTSATCGIPLTAEVTLDRYGRSFGLRDTRGLIQAFSDQVKHITSPPLSCSRLIFGISGGCSGSSQSAFLRGVFPGRWQGPTWVTF
jgi:hypothetical protein